MKRDEAKHFFFNHVPVLNARKALSSIVLTSNKEETFINKLDEYYIEENPQLFRFQIYALISPQTIHEAKKHHRAL